MTYLTEIRKDEAIVCLLCGRDKFIGKQSHNCVGGYRKNKIRWGFRVSSGIWKQLRKSKTSL